MLSLLFALLISASYLSHSDFNAFIHIYVSCLNYDLGHLVYLFVIVLSVSWVLVPFLFMNEFNANGSKNIRTI